MVLPGKEVVLEAGRLVEMALVVVDVSEIEDDVDGVESCSLELDVACAEDDKGLEEVDCGLDL